MTTPSKNDIIEKAMELYHEDHYDVSEINPTESELREDGYISAAISQLMRDQTRAELEEWKGYDDIPIVVEGEHITKHIGRLSWFDLKEQERSNTLITGANQVGKTRLACYLASILRANGWNTVAFDNSGVWKHISDIPNYFQVYGKDKIKIPISRNIIYDISLLRPSRQRKFVNEVLQYYWVSTINNPEKTWQAFILEEFELFGRWLRGETTENIFRLMHVGANQRLRVIAITTDLALIDPSLIRLCMQRYHFKLSVEENSLRKFRRYYGGDWAKVCSELDVGYCMYWNNGKARVFKIPLFQAQKPMVVKA